MYFRLRREHQILTDRILTEKEQEMELAEEIQVQAQEPLVVILAEEVGVAEVGVAEVVMTGMKGVLDSSLLKDHIRAGTAR